MPLGNRLGQRILIDDAAPAVGDGDHDRPTLGEEASGVGADRTETLDDDPGAVEVDDVGRGVAGLGDDGRTIGLDDEGLLRSFSKSTRQRIRAAEKAGVILGIENTLSGKDNLAMLDPLTHQASFNTTATAVNPTK